jgi:hypothetical protein
MARANNKQPVKPAQRALPQAARKASFKEAVPASNKLATRGRAVPAVHDDDDDGVEAVATRSSQYSSTPQFERGDIAMQRLKLGQPMTPEVIDGVGDAGQWLLLGCEPEDTVLLVPLLFGKGRIYSDDNGVLCRSDDSITGEGDPGGPCSRCPLKDFTEDKKGNSVKPACTFYYSYLMWSETHQQIVRVDFKSSHLRVAQQINTITMQKGGLGNFAIELGSTPQSGKKGTYHIPTLKIAKVDPKVLKTAADNNLFQ